MPAWDRNLGDGFLLNSFCVKIMDSLDIVYCPVFETVFRRLDFPSSGKKGCAQVGLGGRADSYVQKSVLQNSCIVRVCYLCDS
jgi:hypothetical protein